MIEFEKEAHSLDQNDELSIYQDAFHFPIKNGKSVIYFCGNSLGLQPKSTAAAVENELKNWREKGVEGHFIGEKPWVKYHHLSKASLSKLLGATPDEVVAMNNLTTNLHLGMASFYRPEGKRVKVLIERGAFPSDFYSAHSQMVVNNINPENLIELEARDGSNYLSTSEIIAKIEEIGDKLALVLFPGIQYYTGQFFNLKEITKAAHNVGAFAGFDLAHAIGNVPMQLHDDEVDFAVWCTYKYLNSGPGAVGGLFIHEKHCKNTEIPRLSGWWGHDSDGRFKMDNQINPIPSVDGWQLSNLNILSQASHLSSLALFDEVGMDKLRAKSLKLTGFLEKIVVSDEVLKENMKVITPKNPDERGCQLSFYFPNHGKEVFDHLIENGVILDWREPNVIRVAPVPFYNSFADVFKFVQILKAAFNK